MKEGLWTYWDMDGEIRAKGNYRDNQRVGPWEEIIGGSETGLRRLMTSGDYVNGLKQGAWTQKDRRGIIEVEEYYQNGVLTREILFWDNGERNIEGQYRGVKKNGVWTFFNRDGTKNKEELYQDGKLIEVKKFSTA
jgi:hypothetical protein